MTSTIIKAVKASLPDASATQITPETRFFEIPGMDSMSVVNFQMEIREALGEKAGSLQPIMDMTISEFAEVLNSLGSK